MTIIFTGDKRDLVLRDVQPALSQAMTRVAYELRVGERDGDVEKLLAIIAYAAHLMQYDSLQQLTNFGELSPEYMVYQHINKLVERFKLTRNEMLLLLYDYLTYTALRGVQIEREAAHEQAQTHDTPQDATP